MFSVFCVFGFVGFIYVGANVVVVSESRNNLNTNLPGLEN